MDMSWEPSEQVDVAPLGRLCAEVMEQISERYGEGARVLTVAVVAEVDTEECSEILVACTDRRAWVQLAFLKEGELSVERLLERMERETEE